MKISILIKAYNEESKIRQAIESGMAVLESIDGEIVLADSCSRDMTLSIAMEYPIKIVKFSDELDRSCGAGAQLAYQHSSGEYVYILDGDMTLRAEFIPEALRYMETHPNVVGVGGIINDIYTENLEFQARGKRGSTLPQTGPVAKLNCGGLYRRSAIEALGYLADRNLHSYEELELGARLRAAGGTLVRIDAVAVDHFTHEMGSYELLWRRLSSRYALGAGEVFKSALGRKHFKLLVSELRILRVVVFLLIWILTIAALLLTGPVGLISGAILALLPVAVMSLRRKSLSAGFFSVISWAVYSVGFARGLFSKRVDPTRRISSQIVKEPRPDDSSLAISA